MKAAVMTTLRKLHHLLIMVLAALTVPAAHADSPTCFGKFANPITDICWSCILPISIGSFRMGDGEDNDNPPLPFCICPGWPPKYGIEIGFWEPARIVEVTRTPYCFVSLGGISMDSASYAPRGAQESRPVTGSGTRGSFYQVHYYVNPVLYWLDVLSGGKCLEQAPLDLAYITEVDPMWNDDDMTLIINPEAVLFANPLAIAACSVDCVAASIGMPIRELFWCAGCNGGIYPMDGHAPTHIGGVQASSLLMQRMLAKMHREFIAWRYHGIEAICGPVPAPVMDKTAYKTHMLYPIPNTSSCQPLGRTTQLWGAGKEYPIKGEDFAYMIFRKRNCCVSYK